MRFYILFVFILLGSFISFSQIQSKTLQPDGTNGKDAKVLNGSVANNNYGSSTTLQASYSYNGSTKGAIIHLGRSLIEFNLNSGTQIPSDAIIVSSTLSLFCNAAAKPASADLALQVVESSWVENSVTYNNQPNSVVSTQIVNTQTTIGGWHDFNVKDHVQEMVRDQSQNFGWKLKLVDEYNGGVSDTYYKTYISSDDNSPAKRPRLSISWVLPIKVENAIVVHASTTTSNDGSIDPDVIQGDGNYTYNWINGSTGTQISTNEVLTGVGPGWYGLEITDGLGNKEYMAFIVGVECEKFAFDFQPGANYINDAFVSNFMTSNGSFDASDVNYGSNTSFVAYRGGTGNPQNNSSSLIKFKIWFDNNINFVKSNLVLTSSQSSASTTNTTEFTRVTQDWGEYTVTHNNQPTYDVNDRIELPPVLTSSSGSPTVEIELKDFFNGWHSNPNFGLHYDLILAERYVNYDKYTGFFSSDNILAKTPKVEFEVSLHCIYAPLKKKLDGGYYTSEAGLVKIQYDEQYLDQDGNLTYNLYDASHTLVASNQTIPKALDLNHGDNRLRLNFSCGTSAALSNGFYVLEVINEKKEKFYLRIKVINSNC